MSPLVLAWCMFGLVFAWSARPRDGRVLALVAAAEPTVSERAGWLASPRARKILWSAVLSVPVGLLFAPAMVLPVAAIWAVPRMRERRSAAAFADSVWAELPETVDLFAVCVGAGFTVPLAVDAVAHRSAGPIGASLRQARRRCAAGVRLADALETLPNELGETVRPVVLALVGAERYGTPLGPTLERVAAEVRLGRRRRAEEHARKVPVRLLFPLVFCILPAFALLTVVPVIAGSLMTLDLG